MSASEPIIPNTLEFSAEMSQTVHLFRLIRRVLSDINPEAIDTYLISPAGRPSDVLTMQWLAKDAGVPDTALDIARSSRQSRTCTPPAASCRQTLFSLATYHEHLRACGSQQRILIGYADSNKEGGYVTTHWELYRAYRSLVYEMPGFVDYFTHATRIEALMYLRIGSRPAKRQQSQRIEDLRRSRGYLHGCKVGMRCRAGTAWERP